MKEEQGPSGENAAIVRAIGSGRWAGIEPSIDMLLSDPIVTLLMRADGLTVSEVENALRTARFRKSRPGLP